MVKPPFCISCIVNLHHAQPINTFFPSKANYDFLLDSDLLNEDEKAMFQKVSPEMEDYIAADSIRALSDYLGRYYGKKPLILLDEYDTPMQEAYVNGYWQEIIDFFRSLFNATFKTNTYFDRAVLTGITRVSRESVFSDLNNLEVVTTTSSGGRKCGLFNISKT